MGGLTSGITDFISDPFGTARAADATAEAQGVQAGLSREGMELLAQQNEIARQTQQPFLEFGQSALDPYGALAGLGGQQAQQAAIDQIQQGPQFQSMMDVANRNILANAGATGGLRGGNTQGLLRDTSQNVLSGLINQQMGTLGGIAGMGANTAAGLGAGAQTFGAQGANMLGGLGANLANTGMQGAQAQIQGTQNLMDTGLGVAGLFMASDERLKDNIVEIGKIGKLRWVSWTWNKAANEMGLFGEASGLIAQDVQKNVIGAVKKLANGYLAVDYKKALGAI